MISVAVRLGLIYLIHQMIANVINKIKGEASKIEGIISTLNGSYLQSLESWQGPDADAFRAEVQNRLNRQLEDLKNTILQMSTNIGKAEQCIVNADTRAVGEVQKLADVFRNIYR